MARHNTTGNWGEQLAADFLVGKGYAIVERNWRMDRYEVDIVAMHGNRLVFVEVKTRTDALYNPAAAVDRRKMQRMVTAANAFVRMRDMPHEVQFDIIGITGTPQDYVIDHIPDAFLPPLRRY